LQLQREIGTTYKTAWRMLKQIRLAMGNENLEKSFELIVEVDETYVGGKPRKQNNNLQFTTHLPKDTSTTGRGTKKTPVIGVKERGTGRVYARVALPDHNGQKLTGKQLLSVISAVTKTDTVVMTDDFKGYNIMNHKSTNPENFTHISVCHSLGEFSSGKGLHTNGIESFWAIFKRAIIGSYHHVSTKYLQQYVNECCFRQNNRSDTAFDKLLWQSILEA
jgi:transposase-like protein